MPSFNPFSPGKGRCPVTLFEIRLDNDFVVFRGSEDESAGHLLKGVVVLCLAAPLKVEEISLQLAGTLRMGWTDTKLTTSGLLTQKIAKTTTVLSHKWPAFVGAASPGTSSKSTTLPQGNYEWPFELMLGGDTRESIEGMHEASLTYRLRATVTRGVLAHDLQTYKRLRVIRTLEPSALEFLHAMSVENIWPNKVEYSIVIPQKAVVFGTSIPLETRYTPLLKGLDLGDITIKLIETQELLLPSSSSQNPRQYKKDREVTSWSVKTSREEHWQDIIGETGQEGWLVNTALDLPKKLGQCMQDVTADGVKIRHKLKIVIALKNPDGHVSELRATLPVSIFISPNMPMDDDGNLMQHFPVQSSSDSAAAAAPPVYGEHILDQLYDEVDPSGLQTPAPESGESGATSPYYSHSRVGSLEDLAMMTRGVPIPPAALSSRLQSMPLDRGRGHVSTSSLHSLASRSGRTSSPDAEQSEMPQSAPLSRQNSEGSQSGHSTTPEHVDHMDILELSKVPSYQTAVKTPARPLFSLAGGPALPDYRTAMSAPASPANSPASNPLDMIREESHEWTPSVNQRPAFGRRQTYGSVSSLRTGGNEVESRRRMSHLQTEARVY